jgi:DNA-binding LacI/PurR family transcriptional regulator
MARNRRRSVRERQDPTPTIKHVAERAGVSTATVSRVLAGGDGVSEELGGRVREAMRTLNYHPNRIARNLRARTTRTIGVVIPNIENPFFTSVVRGIENVLQAADHTLLLGNADEDAGHEQVYLRTLRAEGVAGIIFVPVSDTPAAYRQYLDAGVPFVAIDRSPDGLGIDLVTVANASGARAAVRHLIDLGHRHIGLIGGPTHYSTANERKAGYEEALAAAGLPRPPQLVRHGDFREAGGYDSMNALLDEAETPTAVFVANNLMVLGAIRAIHERGMRIPSDIAVVGFDDMPWAMSLQPPLTTVAQPTYELGATAARMLLARLREPDRPVRHIMLETRLVVRASCGARAPAPPRQG